jgi:LmbE family N-acetylglucosaminyl deacetylase
MLAIPSSIAPLQRIFFSPHPDDVAYSAFGTASRKPHCCAHDDELSYSMPSTEAFKPSFVSPSLSSSSRMTDLSYMDSSSGTASPTTSYSSSTFASSRRNSSVSSIGSSAASADVDGQSSLIVTVFSKSRCANGAIGQRLKRDVEATTTLRTEEDEAFARSIGCDLLQLGFPDSSARDEPSRRPDLAQAAIQRGTTEAVKDVDHYIYKDVRQALQPLVLMAVSAGATIHVPLGVGCHVDHWMVRVAVLSILDELDMFMKSVSIHDRLIFYEDLPYADAQTNAHVESLALAVLPHGARACLVPLSEGDWSRKRAAILAYASQMKPTIIPSLYNHATRLAQLGKLVDPDWESNQVAAERIWIIDADLRRAALQRDAEASQQLIEI